MKIQVMGRGKFYGTVTSDGAGGVVIRIDDERNDEFWAEVRFTRDQFSALQSLAELEDESVLADEPVTSEPPTDEYPRDGHWTADDVLAHEG